MNKKNYLSELKKHLKPLGRQDRKTVLLEIEGLIADSQCEEHELIERFGSPSQLAAQYLEGKSVKKISGMHRMANYLVYSITALFLIIVIGGVFVYKSFVVDQFDYADEGAAELDLNNAAWQKIPLDSPIALKLKQADVVIYWQDEDYAAFNCKRGAVDLGDGRFSLEQDQCLLYLPVSETSIESVQSKLVLVRPQSAVIMNLEQTSLRIADNDAQFNMILNKQETNLEPIPTQVEADITLTITAKQSSIVPYRY